MSELSTSVTALLEDSVNRAFGWFVNELRLVTLRQNLESVSKKVPIAKLISCARDLLAGQSGHEVDITVEDMQEWPDCEMEEVLSIPEISDEQIIVAIQKIALLLNATIEADLVLLTVTKPTRSS